jgi:hypothetical protein
MSPNEITCHLRFPSEPAVDKPTSQVVHVPMCLQVPPSGVPSMYACMLKHTHYLGVKILKVTKNKNNINTHV